MYVQRNTYILIHIHIYRAGFRARQPPIYSGMFAVGRQSPDLLKKLDDCAAIVSLSQNIGYEWKDECGGGC